jgi:hypothetical protein
MSYNWDWQIFIFPRLRRFTLLPPIFLLIKSFLSGKSSPELPYHHRRTLGWGRLQRQFRAGRWWSTCGAENWRGRSFCCCICWKQNEKIFVRMKMNSAQIKLKRFFKHRHLEILTTVTSSSGDSSSVSDDRQSSWRSGASKRLEAVDWRPKKKHYWPVSDGESSVQLTSLYNEYFQ